MGFIRPLALELQQLAFAVWFSQVSHHLVSTEGPFLEVSQRLASCYFALLYSWNVELLFVLR